jgi:hypothetical protein
MAYAAWQRARQDIFEAWTHETDPANLQPRLSRLSREVARYLRKHPPRGVEQQQLQRCLEAVESPMSRRDESQLRAAFERDYPSQDAKARALVMLIDQLGLEPFAAPDPLPPIQVDEVQLVCWLALETASSL